MIDGISKITLYVQSQEEALRFWVEQCGFVVRTDNRMGPVRWIEVAPSETALTSFVLYDKALMEKQNRHVSTAHPSVILTTDNAARTYEQMKAADIQTGHLQELSYGTMFTFQDPDGNEYLLRQGQ